MSDAGLGPDTIAAPVIAKLSVDSVGSVSVIFSAPDCGFCPSVTVTILQMGGQKRFTLALAYMRSSSQGILTENCVLPTASFELGA